jgi:hypothetical protein
MATRYYNSAAYKLQFHAWKKELGNILDSDSDTVEKLILKHWNDFNLLLVQLLHRNRYQDEYNLKLLSYCLTSMFYREYLSENLQFVFGHILQFEEKEKDVATEMDVALPHKQSFVQFIKTRFSPRPLVALCSEIITQRVSNVTDLTEFLPDNLITALQNHKDLGPGNWNLGTGTCDKDMGLNIR